MVKIKYNKMFAAVWKTVVCGLLANDILVC